MDDRLRYTIDDAFTSLRRDFCITDAVCLVDLPFWTPAAFKFRDKFGWRVVYDCMDDHSGFSNTSADMLKCEEDLSRQSDLVLTTSHSLFEEHSRLNSNCRLVPNAVDFDHFRFVLPEVPEELKGISRPVVGYYGAISDWFDSELIRMLALARPHWSFVLIGHTVGSNLSPLSGLKNVHLLEEKPYPLLPKYLHAFDVCVIPFKKTPLTDATNPVKLFEFLSAGKPVVAADLIELRNYSEFVLLANGPDQWLNALETSLADHIPERAAAAIDFARRNTWEDRFRQIELDIRKLYSKASIVIVTYNNVDYTRLCLTSIYERTVYPNFEVIVVDNASEDDTCEFLQDFTKSHSNVQLILNDSNEGFARATNLGVAASSGEYIVFLNNDTIVTRGWLGRLIHHLRDPKAGMVGPVTNSSGNESRIMVDYQNPMDADMERFAEQYTFQHEGQTFPIRVLAFFCVAMRRSVWEEIGPLDERFGIGMFEDDDYAQRIKQYGYQIQCAEDVFVHHWGSASFSLLEDNEYDRLFDENRKKFEEKWNMAWEPHQYRRQ
jgi:GT2 family glycosyltransferase